MPDCQLRLQYYTKLVLINGLIIVKFNMVPFIVTLGMMGIARGLAKWAGNNAAVNIGDEQPARGFVDGFMGVENFREFCESERIVRITSYEVL